MVVLSGLGVVCVCVGVVKGVDEAFGNAEETDGEESGSWIGAGLRVVGDGSEFVCYVVGLLVGGKVSNGQVETVRAAGEKYVDKFVRKGARGVVRVKGGILDSLPVGILDVSKEMGAGRRRVVVVRVGAVGKA